MASPHVSGARWRFVLILTAVAVAVVAAAAAGWRYARVTSSPSNGPIIMVSIDALRPDRLPAYGYTGVKTPAIDELARHGIVFDRAYTHAPETLPAHAALLSGRLPFETGIRQDGDLSGPIEVPLLPQWLKQRGIPSAAVVSSSVLADAEGLRAAFDAFDGTMTSRGNELEPALAERAGAASIVAAQEWIKQVGTPRFFLFLHLDEPHAPHTPPGQAARQEAYDGEVAQADEALGRFVSWLKGRGLYDRATILLVSGHGEHLEGERAAQHGFLLDETALHVPLIVKVAREESGRRVAVPVQHIDIAPTILDLVDAPRPEGLRGRSLRPLLEDEDATLPAEPFYAESSYGHRVFGWGRQVSLFDGRYRLQLSPDESLFDLESDPRQLTDIGPQAPAVRDRLRATLAGMVTPRTAPPASPVEAGGTGPPAERPVTSALPQRGGKADVVQAYQRAMQHGARREFGDAVVLLRQVVEREPAVPRIWGQLGRALLLSGRAADAADAYKRMAALDPLDVTAPLGRAAALLKAGKLDEARRQAELAVPKAPADANELLARIAWRQNDAERAAWHAGLAQEADKTLPMPLFVQALQARKAGKHEDALALLRQAVTASEGRPRPIAELLVNLGDTLSRLERYPEAEEAFKAELAAYPESTAARASLTTLYHAQGRHAEAAALIEDVVRTTPTPEGYATAARLWTVIGQRERAAEVRAQARQLFGRSGT